MQIIISIERPGATARLGGLTVWRRLVRSLETLKTGPIKLFVAKEFEAASFPFSKPDGNLKIEWLAPGAASLTIAAILQCLQETHEEVLVVPGDLVIDPRLLRALVACPPSTALIDTALPQALVGSVGEVPSVSGGYVCGPAVLAQSWLESRDGPIWSQLTAGLSKDELDSCDVARLPTYAPELRKPMRPYWFRVGLSEPIVPAKPANLQTAKRLLLDATQKGALDIPALFHAPIEKFAAWRLADTAVTPNLITGLTTVFAWIATWQFAVGNLPLGISIALAVGVLDGIDGKLARLRLETSKVGELEHWLDFAYEWSWWAALAYHFSSSGILPNAWRLLGILAVAEVIDGLMKLSILRTFGKTIDEMGRFDRIVRLVGGRRNIYVWILALGIFVGHAGTAFTLVPWLEVGTALIHSFRAPWLIWNQPRPTRARESENSRLETSQ